MITRLRKLAVLQPAPDANPQFSGHQPALSLQVEEQVPAIYAMFGDKDAALAAWAFREAAEKAKPVDDSSGGGPGGCRISSRRPGTPRRLCCGM
jgi:hypothetical protein